VNASDVTWIAAMRESAPIPPATAAARSGAVVYATACAGCHGGDRRGRDRAPSLAGVRAHLSVDAAKDVLESGRGFMPSFANLGGQERRAVLEYLGYRVAPGDTVSRSRRPTSPYEFVGYERWRDSTGYPAVKPPWGTLSAIDLNTGDYRWRIPLGEFAALTARGVPITGTEQYGGPIVTAGGLLFIAATQDAKVRAFDKRTGRLLWDATLPAPGYATPSTYAVGGKQFVVIAAGGGKLGSKSSDTYVAYALP
jgi:quinoprotein glucose dehydrogenase